MISCEANVDEVKPREKQVARPVVVVDDNVACEKQLNRIPANTKKATKWSQAFGQIGRWQEVKHVLSIQINVLQSLKI